MKQESKWIYRVTLTAVFAALVFVSSMISVPIPVAIGDVTRIHLGNIFCLLSGFVLGPVGGGLAAGLGSALYDMTNPAYIASAPFTFAFKFMLAAVCGCRFRLLLSNFRLCFPPTLRFACVCCIVGVLLYGMGV